MLIEIGSQKL